MKLVILAAFVLSAAVALPVLAADRSRVQTAVPADQWLTVEQVTERLTSQGFTVEKIESNYTTYQAYLVGQDGRSVEAVIDPASAEILEVASPKRGDDDDDDDDDDSSGNDSSDDDSGGEDSTSDSR